MVCPKTVAVEVVEQLEAAEAAQEHNVAITMV
jgi:hypothetical protein